MKKPALIGIFSILYLLLALFVFIGFATWESGEPRIWRYSYGYFAFLVSVAIALSIPVAAIFVAIRVGPKPLLFGLAPLVALLLIAYFAGSSYYYATRSYPFDPFLQNQPPSLGPDDRAGAESEFRILAIGGSTTENGRLEPELRYPARLQERLAETSPGRGFRVFNGGMSWYTTKHTLINYVTNLRDWNPDVVIVMHAVNDLYRSFASRDFTTGEYEEDWSHFYGPAINGARPPSFPEFLYERVLKDRLWKWYFSRRYHPIDFPVSAYRSLPAFEENLRRLVHYIRADGAVPMLMTQPTVLSGEMGPEERKLLYFGRAFCLQDAGGAEFEYPSSTSLALAMEAFNDATRRVAAETGAGLIDLAAHVPATAEYFVDDVHYTPLATELIADIVGRSVMPLVEAAREGRSGGPRGGAEGVGGPEVGRSQVPRSGLAQGEPSADPEAAAVGFRHAKNTSVANSSSSL